LDIVDERFPLVNLLSLLFPSWVANERSSALVAMLRCFVFDESHSRVEEIVPRNGLQGKLDTNTVLRAYGWISPGVDAAWEIPFRIPDNALDVQPTGFHKVGRWLMPLLTPFSLFSNRARHCNIQDSMSVESQVGHHW